MIVELHFLSGRVYEKTIQQYITHTLLEINFLLHIYHISLQNQAFQQAPPEN